MKARNIHTRLLVFLTLFAVITVPFVAEAFSLGAIRVTGAFNKQFKAEIPVRTDGKKGLAVWIGAKRDYAKLGLQRPGFLNSLDIQVANHPTLPNQKIVYLTSREPIYQPSFNLVVKASMGGGMILENYFIAVDFQKNLALELPSSKDEEQKEIERLARRLAAEKQNKKAAPEKEISLLDKIRMEEQEAAREEEAAIAKIRKEEAKPPVKKAAVAKVTKKIKPKPVPKKPKRRVFREPAPVVVDTPRPGKPVQDGTRSFGGRVMPEGGVLPVYKTPGANVYPVIRGDSLYKIAKKLGASRKDYDRVVVAIWKENYKHFIKGNIHGIRADAEIKYANVNERVKSITLAEARKIISEQWPEWKEIRMAALARKAKRDFAKPPKPVKVPARKLALRSSVLAALADWRKNENLEDTIDLNTAVIISRDGFTEVTVSGKQTEGGQPKVYTLRLSKVNDRYEVIEVIKPEMIEEDMPGTKPFVLHVASYKKKGPAERMIKFLRSKGHNAYQVSNTLNGSRDLRRIVIDRYGSLAEADAAAKRIRKSGVSKYTRILMLPYSVRLGGPMDANRAEDKVKKLGGKGIFAYTMKISKGDGTVILAGAYASKKEAENAAKDLSGIEIKSRVVKP